MVQSTLAATIENYEQKVLPLFADKMQKSQLSSELKVINQFKSLINNHTKCLSTNYFTPGHITGSALVVNPAIDRTVLTLHKKLNKWLQLGGHSDEHHLIHEVALRETTEESGLTQLHIPNFLGENAINAPIPFDLDIHEIPPHKGKPYHLHFDIRYLIIAKDNLLTISEESHDLDWFTFAKARGITNESSMLRQFDKAQFLRELMN